MNRDFISDNTSGVHPRVLEAIMQANVGHSKPYGEGDSYTIEMNKMFDSIFGQKVYSFSVFNGTGGNVAALAHISRRYNAIICSDCAHINEDECAAPENMLGCKLLTIAHKDGKIFPDEIKKHLSDIGSQHSAQPGVISITQQSEKGTIYTIDEIKKIAKIAHENGLYLHMDGARISNAVASANCAIREMTIDAGVDVLSFGGTKNGMLFGEAVIFFDENLARGFEYTRKNNAQLYSKNRFIAAQFIEVLKDGLWLEMANNANEKAKELVEKMSKVEGVNILYPVHGNEIFCSLPKSGYKAAFKANLIHESSHEYSRLVTAFDSSDSDIDAFISLIKE